MTYLDWAATAPPDPDILAEQQRVALEYYGNPSSRHAEGERARLALEGCRQRFASCAGLDPKGLCFVSGGSEADSLPLLSLLRRREGLSIVISAIEHAAIHEQAAALAKLGLKVREVAPGPDGIVDAEAFLSAIDANTVYAACMAVNNETGAIQPVSRIASGLKSLPGRKPRFHVDAVQALGKIAMHADAWGADSLAFSAHKVRGPRGSGVLWSRKPFEPLVVGGGQEGGLRPGTQNLAGAAAFALAAERAVSALPEAQAHAADLSAALLEGALSIPGVLPIPLDRKPRDERYSPWIVCLSLPRLAGETTVRLMSDSGFAISTGSACSSATSKRRVLDAMGLAPDLSFSAIRVSFGPTSTRAELDAFLEQLEAAYRRYRT